jgi:hypothetical protein
MIYDNYKDKLENIEKLANTWSLRRMTLKGKVTIINTLFISQMLYLTTVLNLPEWAIKRYNEIMMKFLWDNKPAKVKYTTLISPISEGGLGLQDLRTKALASKLKWLKALIDQDVDHPWKHYIISKFKLDIRQVLLHNKDSLDYPMFYDPFYRELFNLWSTLHKHDPVNGEQVCSQSICYNSFLKVGDKLISQHQWNHENIKYIQDILNNDGTIMSQLELQKKYSVTINTLFYNSLRASIPLKWKKLLKQDPNILHYSIQLGYKVWHNTEIKDLEELTTKLTYGILIEAIQERATSENKWHNDLNIDIDEDRWTEIYVNAQSMTTDVRMITFNFKVTHRILACRKKLKIWKITDTEICNKCNQEIDTVQHHLINCLNVKKKQIHTNLVTQNFSCHEPISCLIQM